MGDTILPDQRPGGVVRLWLARWEESVYLAAEIEDSTYYWGDDLVISLDTQGDASPAPGHDDFQWYLRRMIDSSVVFRGQNGKWQPPRDDPDWRLGKDREGGGWEVRRRIVRLGGRSNSSSDQAYFREAKARDLPRMAFRVFDDSPQGWYIWPQAAVLSNPPCSSGVLTGGRRFDSTAGPESYFESRVVRRFTSISLAVVASSPSCVVTRTWS
jgi:hypothetical protein